MNDSLFWALMIIAPLGLAQLHSEGKLNLRGLLIEPLMTIVNLFRSKKGDS